MFPTAGIAHHKAVRLGRGNLYILFYKNIFLAAYVSRLEKQFFGHKILLYLFVLSAEIHF